MRTKVGDKISSETQRPWGSHGPELPEVKQHRMGRHSGCRDPSWLSEVHGLWYQGSRLTLAVPSVWTNSPYFLLCGIKDTTHPQHQHPPALSRGKSNVASMGASWFPSSIFIFGFFFYSSKGFPQIISSSIPKFTHYSPCNPVHFTASRPRALLKEKKNVDEWILP